MTDNTRRVIRLIVSAMVAGLAGGVQGLLQAQELNEKSWIIAGLTFVLLTCNSVQSSLSEPPKG